MSEREELRREFSFENAIPNGPWYTFDTEKALDEIAALRSQLAAAKKELSQANIDYFAQLQETLEQRERVEQAETFLTAMTEARDLWQSEAKIQQAHRERAEAANKVMRDALDDIASNYDHEQQTREHSPQYGGACRRCTATRALSTQDTP